jgi:membrane-associated HD superfamily phosphohydrolase
MITKRLLLGFIISPLATAVVLQTVAVSLIMLTTGSTLRDVTDGINRLLIFSTILSYAVVIVVGIPLCILSIRRQWRKLWQNSIAGFSAGLGLGIAVVLIITLTPSSKWMYPYSPFIAVFLFGLAGSVTMTALWPFIEHNKSIQHAQ